MLITEVHPLNNAVFEITALEDRLILDKLLLLHVMWPRRTRKFKKRRNATRIKYR